MSERKPLTPKEKMEAALPAEKKPVGSHPAVIMLAGFMSAFLLLGCCLCGGGMYWFRPRVYADAERARALTQEMVSIDIPEAYQPHGTIEWSIGPLAKIRGAYYERIVGDGVLTLLQVDSQLAGSGEVQRHIRQTLLEEGGGGAPLVIDPTAQRRETFTLSDQTATFIFDIAQDPPSHREFHLVEGVVETPGGQLLLTVRVDSDHWDEPAIRGMLQSIGPPGR